MEGDCVCVEFWDKQQRKRSEKEKKNKMATEWHFILFSLWGGFLGKVMEKCERLWKECECIYIDMEDKIDCVEKQNVYIIIAMGW